VPDEIALRYGLNPHQGDARARALCDRLPIEILNGQPGYINLLDALQGWQLVLDVSAVLGRTAAASLKHTNPIGAGLAGQLTDDDRRTWMLPDHDLSEAAVAYARARGGDRVAAYGDFVAVSGPVDETLARLLAAEVSDGIVAAGFEPAALAVLARKKAGRYLVLRADPGFRPPDRERRELFGIALEQGRNAARLAPDALGEVVSGGEPDRQAREDLALGAAVAKYTQSNAVVVAARGQVIGVGAGQQSRIDATDIACAKAERWLLARHPFALSEPRDGEKRYQRDNALRSAAQALHRQVVSGSGRGEELATWVRERLAGRLASDGSLPFPDNVDRAAAAGVDWIVQPGGSLRDPDVVEAARRHGLGMIVSKVRLFHH
jgi:phosphoribosylaminoimidazolecarboxamide formyltransferase/IMP cyclohydrolase